MEKKMSKKNNKNAESHKNIQIDLEDGQQLSLEQLFQKNYKTIYESILKKSKNALDFEWTSINPHSNDSKYFIEINDKRKFEFNPKTQEIIWYKNLNIPPIRVARKSQNAQPSENVECYVKIMAIRGVKEHSIQQIGLLGEIEKRLEKDQCVFNHLKFKETYFQFKKSSFSLLVIIYENIDGKEQISEVKISSPIRVEARKKSYQDRLYKFYTLSIRQCKIDFIKISNISPYFINYYEELHTSSLLDPFLPDFIEKQYLVFKPGQRDLVPINETLEGLLDYLKAQNIRHKVFHPFFFLIKFFPSIKLYYNSKIITHEGDDQPQELFQLIQKEIYKSLISEGDYDSTYLDKKILILCLNNQGRENHKNKICEKVCILYEYYLFSYYLSKIKQIMKFMKFLQDSSIFFTSSLIGGLPEYFKLITSTQEDLKSGYKKAYNRMSSQKFEMLISQQNNVQSHLSIQKKGRIPFDYKIDKDSLDYLNNIPGPFHKSVYDLTIRNQELRSQADRIQARFEDFNLFSYEVHEDANSNLFGPSLIHDFIFKKNNSGNRQFLKQKNLEKKKCKYSEQGNASNSTKPSSSDSNNRNENPSSREIEKGEYDNKSSSINYSGNSSSSLNNCQKMRNNKDDDFKNKNNRSFCESNHIQFREGESYSSEQEEQSCQSNLTKRKINKQINFNNQFKKICTENSKNYLDTYQSDKFKKYTNKFPEQKEDDDQYEDFEEDENEEIQIEDKVDEKEKQSDNQINSIEVEQIEKKPESNQLDHNKDQ